VLIAKGADIKTVQARMRHMNNPQNANEGAGHRLLPHRHRGGALPFVSSVVAGQ